MLICLFAAFLFFVVRQPANDIKQQPKVVQPEPVQLLRPVPAENPAPLPLPDFDLPEDRRAA